MSVDGFGLLSSDLAHDVYAEIQRLFAAGASANEIQSQIESYESEFADELDEDSYLAAALKGFWEIGVSTATLHRRLRALIESGAVRSRWSASLGPRLASSRQRALQRLLERTASENPTPRRQPTRKRKRRVAAYEVGDCIELHHRDLNFHCLICAVYPYRNSYSYYVVPLRLRGSSSLAAFGRGRYVGHMIGHYAAPSGNVFGPHGTTASQRALLQPEMQIALLGRLPLDQSTFAPGFFRGTQARPDALASELERIQATAHRYESYPVSTLFREA